MRVYDQGAFYRVTMSGDEVSDWKHRWPASGLRSTTKSGTFEKRSGDLVDTNIGEAEDGAAALALLDDMQEYGAKKLRLASTRSNGRRGRRNGSPYYGAPMGYGSRAPSSETPTLLVRRVRIDRYGYAPDGAYFGIGKPVYVVTDADSGDVVESLRAYDHGGAKDAVRAKYPGAKVR
jgi:hypothetical protein